MDVSLAKQRASIARQAESTALPVESAVVGASNPRDGFFFVLRPRQLSMPAPSVDCAPLPLDQVDRIAAAPAKPETAAGLRVTNPFDPSQNVAAGARYLKQLLDRYGGDLERSLCCV